MVCVSDKKYTKQEIAESNKDIPQDGHKLMVDINRLLVLVGVTKSGALQNRLRSQVNALVNQAEAQHRARVSGNL